jgi:hypothetical protein
MATKKQTGTKSRSTSKKGPVRKAVETVGGVVDTVAGAVMAIPEKLTSRKSKSSPKKTTAKKSSTKKSTARKTSRQKTSTQG